MKYTQVLRSFPEIGAIYVRDAEGPVRQIVYKKYRIFYRILDDQEQVNIIMIRHGSRREPIDFN